MYFLIHNVLFTFTVNCQHCVSVYVLRILVFVLGVSKELVNTFVLLKVVVRGQDGLNTCILYRNPHTHSQMRPMDVTEVRRSRPYGTQKNLNVTAASRPNSKPYSRSQPCDAAAATATATHALWHTYCTLHFLLLASS